MDIKLTEKIEGNIKIEEVYKMIKENLYKEGYRVETIAPEYSTMWEGEVRTITGFKLSLNRRVQE